MRFKGEKCPRMVSIKIEASDTHCSSLCPHLHNLTRCTLFDCTLISGTIGLARTSQCKEQEAPSRELKCLLTEKELEERCNVCEEENCEDCRWIN
jgi:hypothetical protein